MKLNLRLVAGWILVAGGIGLVAWFFLQRSGNQSFSGERLTPVGRRPVVLITMDTTRADFIQPYGSETVETPSLQSFAERSLLFERAYAVAPLTLPAHTSILSGRIPPNTGVRNNGIHYVPENIDTLATVLRDEGYRTAAFVSASVLDSRYGLDRGFQVYDDDLSAGVSRHPRMVPDRPAEATIDAVAAWLDTVKPEEDFFLWVHLYDPHSAYNPPAPYRDRYRDDLYAGEIAYMDAQIGVLLDHPALNGENEPIISIMGDHGESLGEHGEETHGILVYDSTMWVPWMLRIPEGPEGIRLNLPVSQVDFMPTVLGALAVDVPRDTDGVDIMAGLGDQEVGGRFLRNRAIYGECYLPYYTYGWSKLHTVRVNFDKLISAPQPELFDTRRDPREMTNLEETGQNVIHDLQRELDELIQGEDEAQEAATLEIDSSTQEQLRALGYLAVGSGPIMVEGERANPMEMIHLHVGLERARQFTVFNMHDEAAEELRMVLEDDPNNLAALVDLATAQRSLGQHDEARVTVLRALEVDPEYSRLHLILAQIESQLGRTEEARKLTDGVLERDPHNIDATMMRCSMYLVDGQRVAARGLVQKALDWDPENPKLQAFFASVIEIPEGETESAERRLVEAVDRDPFLAEGWLNLAMLQKSQGRIAEARASFEEGLKRSPDRADLHRELGLLLADLGEAIPAQIHLEESIRLDTGMNPGAHVALGALLAEQGRIDEAKKHYDLVLEREPENAAARNNRAIAMIRVGNIDEAEQDLEELVRSYPDFADAHNNLALVASLRQQWPEAEGHARRATEAGPNSADAWNNLGYALDQLDRLEEAESAFHRALQINGSHWRARFNLGLVLARLGKDEEAAAELGEVAASQPLIPEVHLQLGELYDGSLARPERARTHYQTFLRLAPNHPRAGEIRTRLTMIE